jgi:hypothetical protein
MAKFNNPDMMRIMRCTAKELTDLKEAFKGYMATTKVGGKPFLGQLPSNVDADGKIQDAMWAMVANKDPTFRSLLSGQRWAGGRKPAGFDKQVQGTQRKIERDLTNEARRKMAKEGTLPAMTS